MIVLTFVNSDLPCEIIIESETVRVRPYRPRVLQCFNCYGFGHSAKVCTRSKVCERCGQAEHEECARSLACVNCKGVHRARDKECIVFKKEQEALLKSVAEHISVGYAKKLLAKGTYSDALKRQKPNSSSSIELTYDAGSSGASSSGAPRAPSGGAPWATSGGAPWPSSGGAPRASSGGARQTISEAPRASPKMTYLDPGIQSNSRIPGSLKELDKFFLPESLPDIENTPDIITVIVHQTDDGEEMEALAVRQKRPRTPSPHASDSSNHDEHEIHKSSDKSKSKDSQPSSKSSLSRPLKREKVVFT